MGRGKQLTSSEKEKITFLREEGYSMRSIAKKINRSYCSPVDQQYYLYWSNITVMNRNRILQFQY